MSLQPTSPEHELAKFREAGFQVEVKESHLLVTNVPYVAPDGRIRRGTLVDPIGGDGDLLGVPPRHTIWWIGEHPHRRDGTKLASIEHSQGSKKLSDSIHADHMFSARPKPNNKYDSFIHKFSTYYDIIYRHAFQVDPSLKPGEAGQAVLDLDPSPFKYLDTASSRAEIVAISDKVRGQKIAIVGLGGTGSYVLDLVAKTPVTEIHMFDGDSIERHNAFRSPGAIGENEFGDSRLKVIHYCDRYEIFRDGLVAHPYYIVNDNVDELSAFNFVFLCVDNGPTRKLIVEYLVSSEIAFVDVTSRMII